MDEGEVFERLGRYGVIAVLVIDREADAVPVAEALMSGGVGAMELALRTPAALGALRRIRSEVPGMLAGIGTILTADQVNEAAAGGAAFGVAPGTNCEVIEAAAAAGLPFAPGICTPSDIERALGHGRRLLKFFPAEAAGGLPFLRQIAAPYAHLGVRYVPLGGVTVSNLADYLRDPLIAAIGGSWLAPRQVIHDRDWSAIRAAARAAIAVRDSVRGPTA